MLGVAAALALAIGVVLGMLGGGGAILTLPMLVYVIDVEPKSAIAMSLFVVGATSLVGTTVHARAGRVRWRLGAGFGATAMVGAFVGGRLAHFVPGTALLLLFAFFMVAAAAAMLQRRGARRVGAAPAVEPRLGRAFALGAGVGLLSGLVGAGGGFVIVPALTLFAGLAIHEAIGTSLFIITLQSFAGFLGHAAHAEIDWELIAAIVAACVVGSVLGASVAGKVPPERLRRSFAWLIVVMGLFVFWRQLPLVPALAASAASLLGVYAAHRRAARAAIRERP